MGAYQSKMNEGVKGLNILADHTLTTSHQYHVLQLYKRQIQFYDTVKPISAKGEEVLMPLYKILVRPYLDKLQFWSGTFKKDDFSPE